ncbi:hypothetical protein PG993_003756 [Apiospora rasikravindrae]|uniref:Uncharacterized protein n=1 Tax=Apiospora rasikravindrae TaxID=990691 RepID=A0ABR1U2M2_9PEZI
MADRQGLPVQYRIVNSSPPIFNDVMVPLPNPAAELQLGSRVAQGIIALSSDPARELPCPLSKASLCITWGLRDDNTEPWCKLWTPSSICDAADLSLRKSMDRGMDDLLDFTRYADCLVPHLHPSAAAVVALGRNIQSAVDTLAFGEEGGFFAHSVTAQIVKATFLDRPKLELSIEVRPTERKPSRTASWFKNQSSITTRGS